MMESLSTTIEAKDEYTRGHSRRVAQYAALIAKNMGWTNEEIQNLKSGLVPSRLQASRKISGSGLLRSTISPPII